MPIDFHTHILPGIDDGSRNVEMSLRMLAAQREQQVDEIVATPHFYAQKDSVEEFLLRRQCSYEKLKTKMAETNLDQKLHLAAERAVGQNRFPCDIGDFNSDTFVYIAAFGLFTEVSYKTSQQLKNIFGHVAYIMEGVKQLRDIPSFRMQVEYDGKVFQDEFIYGMVTNSVSVGGFKGMTGNDVKLDDGLFEVTLIRNPKNPIELNEILACLTNMIDDSDLIYSFKTDAVHITAKEEVPWTLDGEFGGAHREVVIRNLKQRVEIFC